MKRLIAVLSALLMIAIIPFSAGAITEADYDYTLDIADNKRVAISKCYSVEKIQSEYGEERKSFGTVSDMFIDEEDNIYVLCKNDNLVVKLDKQGKLLFSIDNSEHGGLKGPTGIYVDENGEIFVTDTGNARIVHFTADGAYEEEFLSPSQLVLADGEIFSPSKLAISNSGYIYIMSYQNLMKVDANNEFRGYIGSTKVQLTFTQILVNLFATKEQKNKLQKAEPEPYTNFVLGKDQCIYAVTLDYKNGQIKKLNAVGTNIFPIKEYGEISYNAAGKQVKPIFSDITVSKDGVITVIEKNTCKIYQYDNEGNILCVFGGYGTASGMLEIPEAIAETSDGRIVVYDENKGLVFYKPTEFISSVHKALTYYKDCYYVEAKQYWQQALNICESYTLAHQGIGQACLKEKDYDGAIKEYKLGNLKNMYSEAFTKKRIEWLQKNFAWFFVLMIVSVIAAVYLVRLFKRFSVWCEYKYKEIRIGFKRPK